jgi:hypothetical protein
MAKIQAHLLFGCYRKGDANDPDIYVAAIAAVLSHYPPEVVEKITNPFGGLPSRCNFLPTVREVHAACRELVENKAMAAKRQADQRQQLDERRQFDEARQQAPIHPEIGKSHPGVILTNYSEAVRKYGRPIGRFEK